MDIIDNYNRLTMGQYMDILAISRSDSEEIDKQAGILAILTGKPADELLHLPFGDYSRLVARMAFLGEESPTVRIAKCYHLGDFDLVPVTDFRKIETCQYVDFQTFASDVEGHAVELLSTLLVPKGMRYNEGYDILEVQAAIREEMSVASGLSLLAFLLASSLNSMRDSLNFCKRVAKGLKRKEQRETVTREADRLLTILHESGDGLRM